MLHALHYTTLHHTTLHYTTLYTPHYTTPHYTTLHHITLHYTTPHHTTLHDTTRHYTTLNYTTLHYPTLHCITLHCITLHSLHHHKCNCNYTTLIILHHNYNHQWIRSAIHDSQQPTSPIGFSIFKTSATALCGTTGIPFTLNFLRHAPWWCLIFLNYIVCLPLPNSQNFRITTKNPCIFIYTMGTKFCIQIKKQFTSKFSHSVLMVVDCVSSKYPHYVYPFPHIFFSPEHHVFFVLDMSIFPLVQYIPRKYPHGIPYWRKKKSTRLWMVETPKNMG